MEARVWLDGAANRAGELTASLAPQVVLSRATAPFATPRDRAIPVPRCRHRSRSRSAISPRRQPAKRIELAPVALAAGDARSGIHVAAVEPIDGRPNAYMAYEDGHAYPEGGVFWDAGNRDGAIGARA